MVFIECSADGNYEVSYKPNVVVFHSGNVLWNILYTAYMTSLQGNPGDVHRR